MSTTVLTGSLLPDTIPAREDGSSYPFAAVLEDSLILAETRTDIVAGIIDGYGHIPDTEEGHQEALVARYEASVAVADLHQQIIAAEMLNAGKFDHTVEDEDTLTSIFSSRRERLPEVARWDHLVPLVLVATDYAPYTSVTRPEGNVRWVDPYTETTFLNSLAGLGVVELLVNEDAD